MAVMEFGDIHATIDSDEDEEAAADIAFFDLQGFDTNASKM